MKKLEMRVNEELNSLQASMVENLNEMSGCSFSTKNIRLSAVEFADLQLTDDVEKIDLGIIPEANVSSGYKKHFEEIHRAVKDDIRKLQSDNKPHKDGMESLRKWQIGTSGALSFLMISGSGIILFVVWKERSRGRVRSGYAMVAASYE